MDNGLIRDVIGMWEGKERDNGLAARGWDERG
jgi:hypothetical protein